MSSHESRQESSTDANDESAHTCDSCGEPITHTTIAGPGEARNSCGCPFVPDFDVPADTENAFANVAIRAANVTGDMETAALIREGARDRLVTDGGRDLQDIGTVVSSTQFEGDRFAFETSNAAVAFEFMTPELARATAETILPDGYEVVEGEPLTDGGIPESFDDLASTCENCGDNVEPERLIEGECPGCHYHEPVADGGVTWYDLTGFKRDLLRAVAEMQSENARMAGLDIKTRLEEWYTTKIHHGRLYPNLNDLIDAGLLEKGEIDRRTNSYALTPTAIAMMRDQRENWSDLSLPEVAMADGGMTDGEMAEPVDAGSVVGDDEPPTWRDLSEFDAFETTARVEDPISIGTAHVDDEGRLEVGEEFADTEVDYVLAEAAVKNGGEGE